MIRRHRTSAKVLLTTSLLHLIHIDAQTAPKVEVVIAAEAGCPFCKRAIMGPLDEMVKAPGVANIINLIHRPFGNCYFSTKACGGKPYNPDVRKCWAKMCVMVNNPPAECFGGDLVPQHGDKEAQVNRMEACAIRHAPTWSMNWKFLLCMERMYDDRGVQAAEDCAIEAMINFKDVDFCYRSIEGDQAMILHATTTKPHDTVPYVTVNGQPVDANDALSKVCAAYAGEKPAGCPSVWIAPQSELHWQ